MRVCCPACRSEMDADLFLNAQEDRAALAQLLSLGLPLGPQLMRYLTLFKPRKNALSVARANRLLADLLPDIQRGAVTLKGRDWSAPLETWREALERVDENHTAGHVVVPLHNHNYLRQIVQAMADRAESRAEAEREDERRQRAQQRTEAEFVNAANAVAAPAPVPPRPYHGPSSYALRLQRENAARQAAKGEQPADDTTPATSES